MATAGWAFEWLRASAYSYALHPTEPTSLTITEIGGYSHAAIDIPFGRLESNNLALHVLQSVFMSCTI